MSYGYLDDLHVSLAKSDVARKLRPSCEYVGEEKVAITRRSQIKSQKLNCPVLYGYEYSRFDYYEDSCRNTVSPDTFFLGTLSDARRFGDRSRLMQVYTQVPGLGIIHRFMDIAPKSVNFAETVSF